MSRTADNNRTTTMRTMTDARTNLCYEDIIHQLDEQIKYLLNLQDFTTPEVRAALKFVQRQTRYNPDLFLNIRIVEKIVKLGIAHVFIRAWQSISKVDYFSAEQRVSFKNLQTILSIIWNCTDKSASLCDCLVRCDIIKLLLVELASDRLINADLVNDTNALYLIKSYLGILHNLVRLCRDGRHLFRISNAVTVLQSYFGATENLVKIKAYLILSYIINEDENSIINATDENIAFIIRILRDALEGENHFSKQYAFWASEIVCGLNHLAVNDINKVHIGELGALPLYLHLLQSEDKDEQALTTAGVWILAFKDENKRLMRDLPGFIDALKSLAGGCAHEGTRRAARGALWVISTVSQVPNKPQLESGEPASLPGPQRELTAREGDVAHVMLSYPWCYQRLILRVRDHLRVAGFKVWMDVDNMSGSTLDAMALAVEHSALVLVCMSQQYKDSPSCRTEAEYSFRLRKDIIPLLLQPGYVPDGWLGLMVGTRLYFDFTTDEKITREMPRLLREIGTRGKLPGPGSTCSDSFSSLNGLSSMLHNSLSTSSMHSYSHSQQVANWTSDDVQQWLTSCELAVVADRLSDFTGEMLLQYKKMLTDAPEYFYSSLERHLHFDLVTILVFTKALQGLS